MIRTGRPGARSVLALLPLLLLGVPAATAEVGPCVHECIRQWKEDQKQCHADFKKCLEDCEDRHGECREDREGRGDHGEHGKRDRSHECKHEQDGCRRACERALRRCLAAANTTANACIKDCQTSPSE